MSNSYKWLESLGEKCLDAIDFVVEKFRGKTSYDPYEYDDLAGVNITYQKETARRAAYQQLKASFPQVGPYESGHYIYSGEKAWIFDFGGVATIVGPTTWDPVCFEIHGGIYSAWKDNGGVLGPLGRPVSDVAEYHGLDARPGDRVSEFENGVIVWRTDTGQSEVRTYLWHDEFDGYSIDKSKWSFEIGTGNNG